MRPLNLLALAFAGVLSLAINARADTPGEVPVGGYLRDAKLKGLDGHTKKFSDYRGKPLLINVWASWCGPCRAEMKALDNLARRYHGRQFNVIGISTDDDGDDARYFVESRKLSFPNFLDSHVFLENMLGANTIPLTILVDGNGRILDKVRGSQEWDRPEFVQAIGETFGIRLPPLDTNSE